MNKQTKKYNTIKWWDNMISNSELFYSDAEKANALRKDIPEQYKKYLNYTNRMITNFLILLQSNL